MFRPVQGACSFFNLFVVLSGKRVCFLFPLCSLAEEKKIIAMNLSNEQLLTLVLLTSIWRGTVSSVESVDNAPL